MKKLKRDEIKFNIAKNTPLINSYLDTNLMQKLLKTKFLKPILTKKGWLIAKLFKVNKPEVLSYEKAKEFVKNDLIAKKQKEELVKLAKNEIKEFKGIKLGFIGREDIQKIAKKLNISIDEAGIVSQTIFNSKKPNGYTLFSTKAVIYKITAQKLLDKTKYEKYKKNVEDSANQLKKDTLEKNLIQKLMKIYESDIKMYMKI
jgi:peptidyl-prolyl cis-trans isomerase D